MDKLLFSTLSFIVYLRSTASPLDSMIASSTHEMQHPPSQRRFDSLSPTGSTPSTERLKVSFFDLPTLPSSMDKRAADARKPYYTVVAKIDSKRCECM